ncbi:uncharacterized protein LOC110466857 [Mizuhopecten yessoensis]|uniref:TLC domain-containing protein 2 n=1 Tax=Mizuhopecten yessoensis TaxID=6573 RepID=A0A210PN84_MIZYE|nr:uncharacterized protein LOC110466857 [Mizuhopecten yessoensis]OWF37923.1 hypothetical protein KP79_PYT14243 [Mizuhopecten yessoensis]
MYADWTVVLALSLTVNGCVLLHCLCLKGRSYLARKCCCNKYNALIVVSQVYDDKPDQLARRVTEQLVLVLVVVLSLVLITTSGVLSSPFRSDIDQAFSVPIQVTLGIYLGKYIYIIAQHIHVQKPTNMARLRIDIVHHFTTIVCYSIFVIFMQNLLLALIGITMEMNTTLIEFSKTAKDINENKTSFYRKLSVVGCASTTLFRGVVPFVFLVFCIFRETPFDMSYSPLTAFFVSLIFFSVINVWLILNSFQRLYNVYRYHRMGMTGREDCTGPTCAPGTTSADMRNNNLGYMRSYDNRNITTYEDEKLNINKKNFTKDNIRMPFSLHIDKMADNRCLILPRSPEDLEDNANNERLNASRIRNDIGSSRGSTNSFNSDMSGDHYVTILPEVNNVQFASHPVLNTSTGQRSCNEATCLMPHLPPVGVKNNIHSAEADNVSSDENSS